MPVYDLHNKVDISKELGFPDVKGARGKVTASYTVGDPNRGGADTVSFIFDEIKQDSPQSSAAQQLIKDKMVARFSRYQDKVRVDDSYGTLMIKMPRDTFEYMFGKGGREKIKIGLNAHDVVNILERHKVDLGGIEKKVAGNIIDPYARRITLLYQLKTGTKESEFPVFQDAVFKKWTDFKANNGACYFENGQFGVQMPFSQYEKLSTRPIDFGGRQLQ